MSKIKVDGWRVLAGQNEKIDVPAFAFDKNGHLSSPANDFERVIPICTSRRRPQMAIFVEYEIPGVCARRRIESIREMLLRL